MLVAVLALGACSLNSSLGGGSSTTKTWGTTPAAAGDGASTTAAAGSGKLVMPDLTGKTADEAEAALRAAGFASSLELNRHILECEGVTKQVGRISCQSPEAGALVDRHAIINVNVEDGPHRFTNSLVRAQLVKLRGMTIAEAKAYLKSLGHDGEVAILEDSVFSERCGVQKVCAVDPESGTGIHDRLILIINPNSKVQISAPPP